MKYMTKCLMLYLLMSTAPTWASDVCIPKCVPKKIDVECKEGRFKNQCTILGCMGRNVIIVKNSDGQVIKVFLVTPCTGEVKLYDAIPL